MNMPPFDDRALPEEVRDRVRSELRDGERLLWVGQPRPGRFARRGWLIAILDIPWLVMSTAFMVIVSVALFGEAAQGPPRPEWWFLFFFGIPFFLIGLAGVSTPYRMRRQARRTVYAVTDRRAIVWEGRNFRQAKIHSVGPAELTRLRRVEYSGGVGDLILDDHGEVRSRYGSSRRFLAIDGVREVENLLRKALLPGS